MYLSKSKTIKILSCAIIISVFFSFLFLISDISHAAKTDKIKVFFNDPPDSKNIDVELANFIDSAKVSVNAHFYQVNRTCIIEAFIRAAQRLKPQNVKLITEGKYYNNNKKQRKTKGETFFDSYQRLENAGIVIVTDEMFGNGGSGECHNKFCVVDGEKVWTGSYNATDNNTIKDYNNGVILESKEAAKIYNEEFSIMYDNHLFGKKKTNLTSSHSFYIDSVEVEAYFAPTDGVIDRMVSYIDNAKKSVSFVIFAFTEDNFENALYAKYKNGVTVRGMCDDLGAGGKSSGYSALLSRNMDVKKDSNPQSMLHDKFLVVDPESDNALVITGSFNYTKAADTKNDENVIVIHDKYYAQLYYNEFAKLFGVPMIKIVDKPASVSETREVTVKKNEPVKPPSTSEVIINKTK